MKKFCVRFNGDVWHYDNRDLAFDKACDIAKSSVPGVIYVYDTSDILWHCILYYEVVV